VAELRKLLTTNTDIYNY